MKKPPHQLLSLSLFLSVFTSSSTIVWIKREEFQERVEQKKNFRIIYSFIVKKKEPLLDFSNINILKKTNHRYFFSSLTTSTIIISKLSYSKRKKILIPLSKTFNNYPRNSIVILPPFRSVSFNFKRKMEPRAHKMLPRLQFTLGERVEFISKMLGERSCDVSRLH